MFEEVNFKSLDINASKIIGDQWMLITAKKEDKINTMTASWGGFGKLWFKDVSFIFVRHSRFTHEFIENSEYYSLCFFTEKHRKDLNYLGITSGRNEDKIKKVGLTIVDTDLAPYFKEADIVVICRKIYKDEVKKRKFIDQEIYKPAYKTRDMHTVYVGEIVKTLKNNYK
ncbi:MAG: flavin reductase [Bacilli bacterium]